MTRPILTLDFETYFDSKDYSLSKMTTIEYIHDPRFKIHGVGVKMNDEPTIWIDDLNEIRKFLTSVGTNVTLLCHNTAFDGYILHAHFGYYPTFYADTMAMSRGMFTTASASLAKLAERLWPASPNMRKGKELMNVNGIRDLTSAQSLTLGGYCKQDVELTYAAYKKMEPFYPDDELALIDLTCREYCDPILELDETLVQDTLDKGEAERNAIIQASGVPESVLSSNDQFADWIEAQGITVPRKTSLNTGSETDALGKNDLEFQLMRKAHPELEHVWEARIAAKSIGEISRAKRFLALTKATGGKLPVPLVYYSAHTGRYGGGEKINLQNLGRKSQLRRSIRAPEGHLVYVADSSNIEARMNAWHAGQNDLLELFRQGADVYSLFASEAIYHREITKKDNPTERFVGKVAVLGLGYHMGANRFRTTLATGAMGEEVVISEQEAAQIVRAYRAKYNMIARSWKIAESVIVKMLTPGIDEQWGCLRILPNMIVLPNGMALQYPHLRGKEVESAHGINIEYEYYNGKFFAKLHGGILIENIIQALSRIVLFDQMLKIDAYAKPFGGRVVLNVHDEIIVVAPDFGAYEQDGKWHNTEQADAFFGGIQKILRTPPAWCPDLPLDCEGGYDYMYSK